MYDTALDAEAVSQNMAAKLPNSLPVCFDLSVTMNEDGEKQCGASLKEHPERSFPDADYFLSNDGCGVTYFPIFLYLIVF